MLSVPREIRGALSRLVVLDLTQFLAGPYCTQILVDLGARVIKIEPPEGDMTRTLPPHFVRGSSAYYLSVNRSKESVVVDLKQPEGRDLFLRLVQGADVVAENFRPGVMARLGLDYARLAEANPRVVVCSVSGFGQDGPEHLSPAYDIIVQALSGVMSVTGIPGTPPVRTGVPIGDLAAGMFAAIGVLAALLQREATGRGQYVDVAMLDSQISLLSYLAVYFLVSARSPRPRGAGT
jgi:crotonobetainyl-CoA:carnitine CoA-transferase CaiB-like acyl-CoA transferase